MCCFGQQILTLYETAELLSCAAFTWSNWDNPSLLSWHNADVPDPSAYQLLSCCLAGKPIANSPAAAEAAYVHAIGGFCTHSMTTIGKAESRAGRFCVPPGLLPMPIDIATLLCVPGHGPRSQCIQPQKCSSW